MTEIGRLALIVAFAIATYAAVASVAGAHLNLPHLRMSARRGALAVFGLATIASIALLYAILSHDFQVSYVYEYSSSDMSIPYLVSSFWAGNAGSLLLWAWMLTMFGAIVVYQTRKQNRELAPYVVSVVMIVTAFFLAMVVFVSDPFHRMAGVPPEGYGLNPLLENPGMIFHPTTLYIGYVGLTIPFAFAVAALITGRLNSQWIRSTRRWTLFAWLFLGLGNLLGAQWAYVELGWGGYWAWDPIENASFMPWLVATAYLHSVMIQQRRGMLKVWNLSLIGLAFVLVIFGTFLTRSGVLSSVHAFGESTLGSYFLAFIIVTIVAFAGLLIYRLPRLKSENRLDSFISRESSFLLNNLLLVGIAFAVFFGTVFPLISEWVRGVKVTVGPPFFNQVTGPIFLALIVLMGICPLIGWRRASRDNLIRNFLSPFIVTVVGGGVLLLAGIRDTFVVLTFSLCLFVVCTIVFEVVRGVRARHRTSSQNYAAALASLVWRNKPRYGGYIVHIGVILIAIGIVASSTYKVEESASLARGESMHIDGYTLTYENMAYYPTASKEVITATLSVYDDSGRKLATMTPAKTFHENYDQGVTEVAIRSTLKEDLYVILAGWEGDVAAFNVFVNPLVNWMWIGGGVLLLGTVIAVWPDPRDKRKGMLLSSPAAGAKKGGQDEA